MPLITQFSQETKRSLAARGSIASRISKIGSQDDGTGEYEFSAVAFWSSWHALLAALLLAVIPYGGFDVSIQ